MTVGTCHSARAASVSTMPATPALATKYGNESSHISSHVRIAFFPSVRKMTIAVGTVLTRKNPAVAIAKRKESDATDAVIAEDP